MSDKLPQQVVRTYPAGHLKPHIFRACGLWRCYADFRGAGSGPDIRSAYTIWCINAGLHPPTTG